MVGNHFHQVALLATQNFTHRTQSLGSSLPQTRLTNLLKYSLDKPKTFHMWYSFCNTIFFAQRVQKDVIVTGNEYVVQSESLVYEFFCA